MHICAVLRRHDRPAFLEIGVDEVGRGCLAGPVCAGAVLLRPGQRSPADLNDSKQLSPQRRAELRLWIEQHSLAWGLGWASVAEIDEINILQASYLAMHRAIDQLLERLHLQDNKPHKPLCILVDGNRFAPYPQVPHRCHIKGDARFQAIAAASVLAKAHRDALMLDLHEEAPHFGWQQNKGYGTILHREALSVYGQSEHHRQSFRLKTAAQD